MNIYRQGDVIIKPSEILSEASKTKEKVLAEGEVTGHAHRIAKGNAEIYKTIAGLMFLKVLSDHTTLSHEEHEDINLPAGDYKVLIQREWDWFSEEVRRVCD